LVNDKFLIEVLQSRLKRARKLLEKYGDSWLVLSVGTNDTNIDYLLGVHAHGLMGALLSRDELHVLVGRLERSFIRHLEENKLISDIHVFYGYGEFEKELKKIIAEYSGKRILANFASFELCSHAASLSYTFVRKLMHMAEDYEIELRPSGRFVYELRQTKTREELLALEYSVSETMKILDSIISESNAIKPGMTEREIAARIYSEIYRLGEPSFEIIVASGPNTANPHHITSDRKLRTNDIFYIDFGMRYLTMSSDITRFFVVGNIPNEIKQVYEAVVAAQNESIKAIKVGAAFSEPDNTARETFKAYGYDPEKHFIHSLGHALGVDVHDVGPPLSHRVTNKKIPENIAYTVEPALYFEGKYGIRLEDDVVLTKKEVKRLVRSPEEPVCL